MPPAAQESTPPDEAPGPEAAAAADEPAGTPAPEAGPELPGWRMELSRRLQEIKSRREAAEGGLALHSAADAKPSDAAPAVEAAGQESPRAVPLRPRRVRRTSNQGDRPQADTGVPARTDASADAVPAPGGTPAAAPAPESTGQGLPAGDVVVRAPAPETALPRQREIRELIDAAMARQAAVGTAAAPTPALAPPPSLRSDPGDDKLILLSRTLAGLVDIIIVIMSASFLVFAADVLEGIDVFDTVSMIHYLQLVLATYFVYSLFFLGTSSQTIGMMMTDLKVTDLALQRPRLNRIVVRSITYVLSVAGLGAGLLWGCFDRHSRCLHDRLSGTRVVRLAF